jgi:SAM-dependent methyltransferase
MAEQQPNPANTAQREFWNSPATRAWADQHERMDRALADFTKQILEFAAPRPGEHVLDIGCGGGTTTLELAARVGPSGHVLGADISEHSIARVRQRIADAGPKQAEAIVADVSVYPFAPASIDLVFSRFGVMFFADPTAAFANVCRAVKPGGRLAVAVFRTPKENLWPQGPLDAVRHLLPPIPMPGRPGPVLLGRPGAGAAHPQRRRVPRGVADAARPDDPAGAAGRRSRGDRLHDGVRTADAGLAEPLKRAARRGARRTLGVLPAL